MVAAIAEAMMGPKPGMVISRRAVNRGSFSPWDGQLLRRTTALRIATE
jgi:hypothetical protein